MNRNPIDEMVDELVADLEANGPSRSFYDRLDELEEPDRSALVIVAAQILSPDPEDWMKDAGLDMDSFLGSTKELAQRSEESGTKTVSSIRVAMEVGWYMGAMHERYRAGNENPYALACRLVLRVPTYHLEGGRVSEASPPEKTQMIAVAALEGNVARLSEIGDFLPDAPCESAERWAKDGAEKGES